MRARRIRANQNDFDFLAEAVRCGAPQKKKPRDGTPTTKKSDLNEKRNRQ